ncbi:uncharacterized protein LOC130919861 [Corythoichthys intestinalis]|uniref:uncharacterized protein LOC130919861 n=1 Tax=Corythoichthys intestinalis TaxID=161448 RepID=UPI0025A573C5|nr:uncharacterized protein LOC130919861 [Corythoichthys intestinalis]
MKRGGVVALLLGLLSLGRADPPLSCDTLLKPISITNHEMLGRWLYIGGSSDLPGSRSLGYLLNSIWLDIRATPLSNVLTILQTQKIYNECSSMIYNVTMENSTMLIEHPFYLKEVYLQTDCPDCLVVFEEVKSSHDSFRSLMLFSRQQTVSTANVEMLRMQAKCLQMPSPLMMDPNYELCPDNLPASDGLAALNSLLEAKMGQRVARLLDTFFDLFIN